MSQAGIFAIKLDELERQYERTLSCLRLYQSEDHAKIRKELEQVFGEYRDAERRLQKEVNTSRSPAVAALSEAQLDYDRRIQWILREKLPGYLHGGNSSLSADQVEAVSLYGEYAIDFATQAMRYALLSVLSAIDAQMNLDEHREELS